MTTRRRLPPLDAELLDRLEATATRATFGPVRLAELLLEQGLDALDLELARVELGLTGARLEELERLTIAAIRRGRARAWPRPVADHHGGPVAGDVAGPVTIIVHGPPPGPSPMAVARDAAAAGYELGRRDERRRPRA